MNKDSYNTQDKIEKVCYSLIDFLKTKNKNYGDSALNPISVFSTLTAAERMAVRMDDKISRIVNSEKERKNDYLDLLGYLVLKMVEKDWLTFDEFID